MCKTLQFNVGLVREQNNICRSRRKNYFLHKSIAEAAKPGELKKLKYYYNLIALEGLFRLFRLPSSD